MALAVVVVANMAFRLAPSAFEVFHTDDGAVPRAFLLAQAGDPSLFNPHLMTGGSLGVGLLLALEAFAAVALGLGWRTRSAAVLCWWLELGLQRRNPMVLQAGDAWLRMELLFAALLPVGACWSVDARRASTRGEPRPRVEHRSWLAVAYMLQVVLVYVMTGTFKALQPTWREGLGAHFAFSLHLLATPVGVWVSQQAPLCAFANWLTLAVELGAPWLVLVSPAAAPRLRALAVGVFASLHVGIALTLHVGLFSYLSMAAWCALLPTFVCDSLESSRAFALGARLLRPVGTLGPAPHRASAPGPETTRPAITPSRGQQVATEVAGLGLAVALLAHNLGTLPGAERLGSWVDRPWVFWLGLDQRWDMFARPIIDDGWFLAPAKLTDGRVVDLLQGDAPLRLERPAVVSEALPGDRWRKYLWNLWTADGVAYRRPFAESLCRRAHARGGGLEYFHLVYVRHDTQLVGPKAAPAPVVLWRHECVEGTLPPMGLETWSNAWPLDWSRPR